MLFNIFKRNKNRYSRKQINMITDNFRNLINHHILNFQKIIESITNTYPKFHKYYEIDDNPNIVISQSDSTIGCSLTFTDLWDISTDICNSQILDPAVIDKIFEMEDKILNELRKYCEENRIPMSFSNDKSSWDDAGIYCNMNINSLNDAKNEFGIFENVEFL